VLQKGEKRGREEEQQAVVGSLEEVYEFCIFEVCDGVI